MSAYPLTIDRPVLESVAGCAGLEKQPFATALEAVDTELLSVVDALHARATADFESVSTVAGRTPDRLALGVPADDWERLKTRLPQSSTVLAAAREAHRRQLAILADDGGHGDSDQDDGLIVWSPRVAAFIAGGFSLESARVWAYKLEGKTHREIATTLGIDHETVCGYAEAGHERIADAQSLLDGLSRVEPESTAVVSIYTDDTAAVLFDDGAIVLVGEQSVSCSEHGAWLREDEHTPCPHTVGSELPAPQVHAADLAEMVSRDPTLERVFSEQFRSMDRIDADD